MRQFRKTTFGHGDPTASMEMDLVNHNQDEHVKAEEDNE
jgi:hypothetical protein